MEIRHYLSIDGVDIFQSWFDSIRDQIAKVAILRRLDRIAAGNFGDCKALGNGLFEMRVHVGEGYRVYYFQYKDTIVVLLSGGTKKHQNEDISHAKDLMADYIARVTR